jgi:hypothetical protein
MTWVEGKVEVMSWSMRTHIPLPALLMKGGIAISYSGVHMGKAIFGYRAPDLIAEDVVLRATRRSSGSEHSASSWLIETDRLSSRYKLTPQRISELKQHLAEAFLSHPSWLPDYQPGDSPVSAVEFTTPD